MKSATRDRLGAAAIAAGILTGVIALGQLLDEGELNPVEIGVILLASVVVAYLMWPMIGSSYGIETLPSSKQVGLMVLGGVSAVIAPRLIAGVPGWDLGWSYILLVLAVIVVGLGFSRLRAHRSHG